MNVADIFFGRLGKEVALFFCESVFVLPLCETKKKAREKVWAKNKGKTLTAQTCGTMRTKSVF